MKDRSVKKAVFFDWFNTLVRYDPPREELHSQVLHEFGIEISPSSLMPGLLTADKYFFAEVAHTPLTKRSKEDQAILYVCYAEIMLNTVGLKVDSLLFPQLIKRWPQIFSRTRFILFDDVLKTLKKLKERQLILGLITNATSEAVSIRRELGLEPYLDFTVTSEEAGTDKPDTAIFRLALERARTNATEAVHVGDQYDIDIVGARRADITPVLIDRYDLYTEISDCPRIRTLPELVCYL